jgi:hypothetical protein
MIERRAIFVFDTKVVLDPLVVEPRKVFCIVRAVSCDSHRNSFI